MKPTLPEAYEFFHEGTEALSIMEENGIRIDLDYLDGAIKKTEREIREKERRLEESPIFKKWKNRFGKRMNLDSTQQLAAVLEKDMGYKPKSEDDLTFTGKLKTDEYTLRHVDNPFMPDYFSVKKLKKSLGTYLKGYRREVCGEFLHPSYNLAGGFQDKDDKDKGGAASYRSSCSMPNFTNIPVRNKVMEKLIRPCFIPRKGRRFVCRDLSGVEVRTGYFYHKDPTMKKYLRGGGDMHRDEAQQIYCTTPKEYEKHKDYYKSTIRDSAKNQWVFPQFYGSVWFQCAPNMWEAMEKRDFRVGPKGITMREHLAKHGIKKLGPCKPDAKPKKGTFARHLIEVEHNLWNKRFPVYTEWKKKFYSLYLKNAYFDLLTGFRCTGYYRRNQVVNFPIQGVAFHCLLWIIIQIQKEIRRRKMRTLLVGEIHDDIIADVPEDEIQEYLELTHKIITIDLPKAWKFINIEIEAEAAVTPKGGSWYDKEEWTRNKKGIWALKV